eukprot:snap_masked-scaffold_4-processed-gene-18.27-mRNA-1 protein AED:0.07 eAED:0.07 QI:0/-1/0/1/-1/1/1/0/570
MSEPTKVEVDVEAQETETPLEVSSPNPILDAEEEKAEQTSAIEEAEVIDRNKNRVIGEEGLPSYTPLSFLSALPKSSGKAFIVVAYIALALAALIINASRAADFIYIGVFVAAVVLLGKIFGFFSPQFLAAQKSLEGLSRGKALVGQFTLLLIALAVALYISRDDLTRMYGLFGLVGIIFICYVFSWNRKAINWRPVIWGFSLQYVFALLILQTEVGENVFNFLAEQIQALLNFTNAGVAFVFSSNLASGDFAFGVLPVIILFSGLTSVLFYMGILQAFTLAVGKVMVFTMGTSAPESFSAAGNIFLGQTEAPLLIRPYLSYMTNSEIHAIMTGGFATIAGGVLAAFISFGIPANHLLSASVMSAPAALAISKIVYPETMKVDDTEIHKLDIGETYTNVIEAFSTGCTLASGLIANIIVNLIGFLAIVALLNNWAEFVLNKIDVEDTDFQDLIGYLFSPFALLMGINADDVEDAGRLIGTKIVTNEFVAFLDLVGDDAPFPSGSKTFVIMTYALCGFSNLGSMGIQIGALSLMAPNKLKQLSSMAFSAMVCGNIACFMTACIAGVLVDLD